VSLQRKKQQWLLALTLELGVNIWLIACCLATAPNLGTTIQYPLMKAVLFKIRLGRGNSPQKREAVQLC
jgi:hypothetical protein